MKSYYGGPVGTDQRSFERYHLRHPSNTLQIWQVYSRGPSEQKHVTNLGEMGAWAYPGTVQTV